MSVLTASAAADFDRDGFVVVEDLFAPEEIAAVLTALDTGTLTGSSAELLDESGRKAKLQIWANLPDNEVGTLAGAPRLVNIARMLLRDDVYHWHSKVMMKVPGAPGQWEWHQDYGYWYTDGCPFPRMLSAMIALDPATRQNGCLKVLVGSHQLGRLDHQLVGEQQGADPRRIGLIEQLLPVRYLEARPGTVVFFHCNTLHSSEANLSDQPRRAVITAYNALSNIPITGPGHGRPEPIVDTVTARVAATSEARQ